MHEFTIMVRKKGWLLKELGERWGLQPRQMSEIASMPRQIHIDALKGLPKKKEADSK